MGTGTRPRSRLSVEVASCWNLIVLELFIFNFVVSPASCDVPMARDIISINCGGRQSQRQDPYTKLTWENDELYLQDFERLQEENITVKAAVVLEQTSPIDNEEQLKTAMVFYPGNTDHDHIPRSKYCYKIPVLFNENEAQRNYLLRATFPSSNLNASDRSLSQYGTRFYFSVDSTYIATMDLTEHQHQIIELIIIPLSTVVYVCLVPLEDRSSMPAIAALELSRLAAGMYDRSYQYESWGTVGPKSHQGSYLLLFSRWNFGGNPDLPSVRYPNDTYDRIWSSQKIPINQSSDIFILERNITVGDRNDASIARDTPLDYPGEVYRTAWMGADLKTNISFTLNLTESRVQSPTPTFYLALLFHDTVDPRSQVLDILYDPGNGFQEFFYGTHDMYRDWYVYHKRMTFMSDSVTFTLRSNASSDFPVMINGVEIYGEFDPVISRTDLGDVEVIEGLFNSTAAYDGQRVLFDRAGDPCLPIPWAWIICSIELPPRITQINVTGKGVTGTLPVTLGRLSRLTILDLSNNSLDGDFPSSVGNISSLRELNLEGNKLSGDLPTFGAKALGTLEYLSLGNNKLSGNLSSLVTALEDPLSYLNLSNNTFTGPIPTDLERFTNLKHLDLSHNNFSGELGVDHQLWKLQKLQTLKLDGNNLTGDIPDIMSRLPSLKAVNLDNNKFRGLNLTTWYSAVIKKQNFDAFEGAWNIHLLGNEIQKITLESEIPTPADDDFRTHSPQNPVSFILLGDNPWCKERKKVDRTLIERYLCRSTSDQGVSKTILIIVGLLSGLLVFVMSCVLIFFLRRMRRRTRELQQIQEALAKENVKPPFFKYETLKTATHNFTSSSILGSGGFGTVYKAMLPDGNVLAVKKLIPTDQNMSDFLTEMVNITGIKHRNLIQLKGCCVREKNRILVYEYAENKNLAEALWGPGKPFVLSWKQRFSICLGIARGLVYLHEELQPKMVHRDIKPQNILLDKDYNAKIADFGLVRPSYTDKTQITFNIGGTMGYCSPEYINEGMVSEKLDIYSFGIVLLEVVSGRECIDHNLPVDQIFLRNWALELYEENKLLDLVDEELLGEYIAEEVLLVLQTALRCCQLDWRKRPTMSQIVNRFMQHEDVATDIVRELKGRRLTFENIEEEDLIVMEPVIMHQGDENEDRSLLSLNSEDSSRGTALELSAMRPR